MYISDKRVQTIRHVLFLVLLVVILAGCSGKNSENMESTYSVFGDMEESMPIIIPPIQLEMPDYKFAYSGEFKDVIDVQKLDNENALLFTVRMSQEEKEIFTLLYNTDEGEFVTVLENEQGNQVPIAFKMASLPENLSAEDEQLFCSAQEIVNEIVDSLVLK